MVLAAIVRRASSRYPLFVTLLSAPDKLSIRPETEVGNRRLCADGAANTSSVNEEGVGVKEGEGAVFGEPYLDCCLTQRDA